MPTAPAAKLACTAQYLERSYQMPSHVQKALQKFHREFPKDTAAATWHVEPISTFRDPQLRTARANQQYRIILRVPFAGDDTWYLLWVDNHDEAMAWAENKVVEWNSVVQAVQVYDVAAAAAVAEEAAAAPPPPQHPLDGISDAQLIRIGLSEVLLPAVRHLKDFFEVDRIRPYIPEGVYENLLHLFAGDPIENLIRDVEEGLVPHADFQAQKQSANNRRSILELSGDEALDEALLGDFAAWRVFLHPSQRLLAEGHFRGPVKLTGGAGTGKTVAALHRAKHLSEQGEGMVLFTTFTKSLTEELEAALRSLGARMDRVRVTNLDALANQLARELGLIQGRVGIVEFVQSAFPQEKLELLAFEAGLNALLPLSQLLTEYTEVILEHDCQSLSDYQQVQRSGRGFRLGSQQRTAVWDVLQQYQAALHEKGYMHQGWLYNALARHLRDNPALAPFRHIVADEIQDLGLVKLRLLRALAPPAPNDLFLAGDPLQKIYAGQTIFNKARIEVRGKRSRKLKINYRTTEQIRRYALRPIAALEFEDFDGGPAGQDGYISLRSGAEPAYERFESPAAEHEWLLDKVQAYLSPESPDSLRPSEIAVAVPKSKLLNDLAKAFHQAGIPYYKSAGSKSTGDRQGVLLSTMHGLKGHEYKIVFLTAISAATYPAQPSTTDGWAEEDFAAYHKQQAALLYVACSRAVWRLYVSGVGEGCGMVVG